VLPCDASAVLNQTNHERLCRESGTRAGWGFPGPRGSATCGSAA